MTDHKKKTKPEMQPAEEIVSEGQKLEETSAVDIAALEQELATSQAQAKEFSEGWQRERADFLNYKKRVERDQTQLSQVIASNILKKYLSVMDDMERALTNKPQSAETQDWWAGVELIYRKLTSILEAEGVQTIPAVGETFDPNLHEAITHEDCDSVESGKIIAVVQQGYRIGERIIRPALVRVAR